MKKITETVESFQCDKCRFSSPHALTVERHEKTHKQSSCNHVNKKYMIQRDADETYVECLCVDCQVTVQVPLHNAQPLVLERLFYALGGIELLNRLTTDKKKKEDEWKARFADFEKKYGRPMTPTEIQVFGMESL